MRILARCSLLLLPAAMLFTISGCTVKASTKTLTDGVLNFLSSTSGKSWVTADGLVKDEYKAQAFAAINFENLKQNMAQGQGEYLGSLGNLLGVPKEQQAEFFLLTQERYPLLIPSDETTPEEMLAALHRELVAKAS